MNLIVVVDKEYGIGCDGGLLVNLKEDMEYFKNKTIGKIVVMGRKTLESLPQKKPLKDRINIVLTSDKNYKKDNCIIVNSKDELFKIIEKYNDDDVFIIGGEKIYNEFEKYCKFAYITKVYKTYKSDKKLFNIDKDEKWILKDKGEKIISKNNIEFNFNVYENEKVASR